MEITYPPDVAACVEWVRVLPAFLWPTVAARIGCLPLFPTEYPGDVGEVFFEDGTVLYYEDGTPLSWGL